MRRRAKTSGPAFAAPKPVTSFETPVSGRMTHPVVTVPESAPLWQVQRVLRDARISCLPVLDPTGKATGVISRTDLLRLGRGTVRERGALLELPELTAREAMRPSIASVAPGDSLRVAARRMVGASIHRVFVEDEGRLLGVLSVHDLMPVIRHDRIDTPVRDVMSSPARTVLYSVGCGAAADRLACEGVHGLVVTDEGGWPLGTFSQEEVLWARAFGPNTPVEDLMNPSIVTVHVLAPLHRAVTQAHAVNARRVLAIDDTPPTRDAQRVKGILTGLDLARVIAGRP
jgi:predicted transcriptional regulator